MRLLFVTWAGGGNSTPVLGLATRLVARGHAVTVVSPGDAGERFAAVGIAYEPLNDVAATIERLQPDVVVVDFMMPAWMCEAEASGVPWVACVHTLYDRVAVGILTAFTTLERINEQRVALRLDELIDANHILDRAARVLVTAPRELDTDAPPNGAHVGTILEEAGPDAGWVPPWSDGRTIAVSLGTTQGLDDELVTRSFLEAAAELPVNVLVNVPAHIDVASLAVPPNAVVQGYVRHAAVLPHVDAMVNHAGLGSITAALSFGLPMVCMPLGRDQPHNAERVQAIGAGVSLSPDASASEIRTAVERVLDDPRYRNAAEPFAAQYDPTAHLAINELESL